MAGSRRRRGGSWKSVLRRLRESLTEERKLREFREQFGRDPSDDEELELFIEELTLEMYNSGEDEWPPEEPEPPA